MLSIEKFNWSGLDAAIRGMRNPKNSWDLSDSTDSEFGPEDRKLAINLSRAGSDHAKYRRMIVVWADITAPLYWWKEFDTYKIGTVANSCSTMHKIHSKKFELGDFSHEHLITFNSICSEIPFENLVVTTIDDDLNVKTGIREGVPFTLIGDDSSAMPFSPYGIMREVIAMLNRCRELYLETNDKKYWWQLIQLLPSSYNQKRTVMLNYEVLGNIYHARRNHKLDEWHSFCDWIEMLPYSELIIKDYHDKS